MKRLLLIYNPQAGKKRIAQKLHDVVYLYTTAGYEVTVHPTLFRGDATRIAAELGTQYDHVVCCGGDGTLNEVVTGLMTRRDQLATLGYIPAGTTNDFSKTLKLPADLMKAAQVAVEGSPCLCDMGEFNGRTFVYVAAFGVFSEVSYTTPQSSKNALGHLAYVLGGIKSLTQLRPYTMKVTHDGETIEGDFIYGMVSDSISVGGFQGIKKDNVKLDDGQFEVMLVKNPRTPEELSTILNALMTKKPDGNVIGFQSGDITFESQEQVAWTLDGEYGGDVERVHIRNLNKVVRIMRG